MMDFSFDPFGDLGRLKAEYERAECSYRVLSRRLDRALKDDRISASSFAEMNKKRSLLLDRMKEIRLRINNTNLS